MRSAVAGVVAAEFSALVERFLGAGTGAATAAARAFFAHVVEAAQFTRFFIDVPVDVGILVAVAADADFGRPRFALTDHRLQGQHRRVVVEAEMGAQGFHFGLFQFHALAAFEQTRQGDVAVAYALQAADLIALRFPQAADFAVAAFGDDHLEPGVRITGADAFDFFEFGRTVIQRNAAGEAVDHVVGHFAVDAADVFAFDVAGRMHQGVGQFAVGGQQQKTGGVDVETADRDPARAFQAGQGIENGRAAFGIFAGGDFAFGLVVDQHRARFAQGRSDEHLAVDFDAVAAGHRLAGLGGFAVDLDRALRDAFFQQTA